MATKAGEKQYAGSSLTGSFQEALDKAVDAAVADRGEAAMGMVRWELIEASGNWGGFRGGKEVIVTIKLAALSKLTSKKKT